MSKLQMTVLLLAGTLTAPLRAQSGGNGPGDFMVERSLTPPGVLSPTAPNLPESVLAGWTSGAIEIRQRFTYDSARQTLDQLAFVVPGKSPLPFANPGSAPVADHYVIQVDRATLSSTPQPSINLIGRVILNDVATPYGYISGAGVTLTIGYRGPGAAVEFGPILESVSPIYGLYTTSGAGSLSLVPRTQACTLGTLKGSYIFDLGGYLLSSPTYSPWVDSGVFDADGNGNLTVVDSGNLAGSPFLGRTFTSAYTMKDNCTGTLTLSNGNTIDFQLSRDGSTINMVFTKPSNVIAKGIGRRQ